MENMTWRYKPARYSNSYELFITEVYYENNEPVAYIKPEECNIQAETINDLKDVLNLMLEDLNTNGTIMVIDEHNGKIYEEVR